MAEVTKFLSVISYNCNSIRNKIDAVRNLLLKCDLLVCQEVILLPDERDILYGISSEFDHLFSPSLPSQSEFGDGRPKGGMVFFFRRSLNLKISMMYDDPNLFVCNVSQASHVVFTLACVYFPCDNRSVESLIEYQQVIGKLQSVIDASDCYDLLCIGDFNADPNRNRMWSIISDFAESNGLTFRDLCLPSDTFTYLSPSHNTTSWLDHILTSQMVQVHDICVLLDASLFDHFPIACKVKLTSVIINNSRGSVQLVEELVNWPAFDESAKENYNMIFYSNIESFDLSRVLSADCDYVRYIESLYDAIMHATKMGTLPYKFSRSKEFNPVPGWNEFCKNKYSCARSALLAWVSNGRIRMGEIYERMIATRKIFKASLRYCRSHEMQIRNNILVDSYNCGSKRKFWREVNKKREIKGQLHTDIDGETDSSRIATLFRDKFASITGRSDGFQSNTLPPQNSTYTNFFSLEETISAVKLLKHSIGYDGLHSNHLKFLDRKNANYVKFLFNACVSFGYIPAAMLEGVVKPIVKNKFGDCSSSDNYREIMISSCLYKALEYCILPLMERSVLLSPHQFGYRAETSTKQAAIILKEVLHRYVGEGSRIYSCFIDFSRAFERVDHRILLEKMSAKGMPVYIVNLFRFIFSHSDIRVVYDGEHSDTWRTMSGVRQGAVTSAYLFSLYLDDVLTELHKQCHSCFLGWNKINVLAYADDLVVFCPTVSGLKSLLGSLERCVAKHRLMINVDKTKFMVFETKRGNLDIKVKLNGVDVERVDEFKYLGCVLQSNLLEGPNVERLLANFNKSVGMFMRKFSSLEMHVKIPLFESLCLSFYGIDLFMNRRLSGHSIRKLGVAYHYAYKRLLGFPKRFSNHYTCAVLQRPTFSHFINQRLVKFLFWLKQSDSPCFVRFKTYFMKHSHFLSFISRIFNLEYNVSSVCDNDCDALLSRIVFVQTREASSLYGVNL